MSGLDLDRVRREDLIITIIGEASAKARTILPRSNGHSELQ